MKTSEAVFRTPDIPSHAAEPETPKLAEILSRRETARHLGICLATLDRLDIPRTRIGRRVFYRRDALAKWIDRNTEKAKRGKA